MIKYRVSQIGEHKFRVESKFLWFWPNHWSIFNTLEAAERSIMGHMREDEKLAYVPRVVGNSAEYELRYLRQRIEEITK